MHKEAFANFNIQMRCLSRIKGNPHPGKNGAVGMPMIFIGLTIGILLVNNEDIAGIG